MNKHSKLRFAIIVIVGAILLICAVLVSKRRPKDHQDNAFLMDTFVSETLYGADTSEAFDCIKQLDSLFSAYNENSEIYKLNSRIANQLSVETLDIITKGIDYTKASKGFFDITLFPVTSLWGISTDSPRVPSEAEITEALKKVGTDKIQIASGNITLTEGAMLDLGAIAKGYACDKVYEIYKANSKIKGAVLSFGSSILLYGSRDKNGYRIALRNPDNAEASLGTITLGECFVSTSGGYERNFTVGDKTYAHIFNPKTGYPAESDFKSVTIISDSGILGDYLSTAVYAGGEAAMSLIPKNCSYIIVDNNHRIHINKDFSGSYSILDASYEVIYE